MYRISLNQAIYSILLESQSWKYNKLYLFCCRSNHSVRWYCDVNHRHCLHSISCKKQTRPEIWNHYRHLPYNQVYYLDCVLLPPRQTDRQHFLANNYLHHSFLNRSHLPLDICFLVHKNMRSSAQPGNQSSLADV